MTATGGVTGTATCTSGPCAFTLGLSFDIANYTPTSGLSDFLTGTGLTAGLATPAKFTQTVTFSDSSGAPALFKSAGINDPYQPWCVENSDSPTTGDCIGYNFAAGRFEFGGITLAAPLAVTSGGTGGATASAARTALGVAIGTDVQAYDADLAAVAGLSTAGLVARTGAGTAAARTITGPAAGITVSNGDGVSGNPTLALANDLAGLEGLGNGLPFRNSTWAVTTPTTSTVPYYTTAGGLLSTSMFWVDANTLEMRNGTSGQEFRTYNSYTDASNYERTYIGRNLSTTVSRIGTDSAGTGVARQIRIAINSTDYLTVSTSGASVVGALSASGSIAGTTSDSVPLGSSSTLFNHLYLSRSIQGGTSKALTEGVATSFIRVAIPSGSTRGASFDYMVHANDGTEYQSLMGEVWISGSNKAGTISIGTIAERQSTCACSSGTLTATVTVVDAGSGNMDLKIDATSSLTQTTLAAIGRARLPLTATISFP